MIRIYECIVHQHDWRLLSVAVLLAFVGSFSAVAVLRHARMSSGLRRQWWAAAAAGPGACGVWSTHFVAMLGFTAGAPLTYDPALTLLSLAIAFMMSLLAFSLTARAHLRWGPPVGGVVFGTGIAAMHFTGMAAVNFGFPVDWQTDLVVASVLIAVSLGALSLIVAAQHTSRRGVAVSAVIMMFAIGGLHFTAMAALVFDANPAATTDELRPPWWLATEVTVVSGLVILSAMAALTLDRVRAAQEAMRIRDFADLAVEGLLICDGQKIVAVNKSLLNLHGSAEAELVGRPITDFVSERDRDRLAAKAPGEPIETEFADAEGKEIPVELAQRHTNYCGSPHAVVAVRDLRARRAAQQKIRFLAFNDPLTGLANRESFTRQLKRAIDRNRDGKKRIAVLALDLDNFKAVNDTLGHPVGDQLLSLMAERIQSTCRQDDVVGRLGGDEFAVFQTSDEQPVGAESLGRRLIELLSRPAIIEGQIVTVGASVGIALSGRDGETVEELMKNADLALYKAKDEGRGAYVFFEPEMDSAMRKRRALENDLRLALARSELTLAYHPLIQARSNELSGFEALLRWSHPDHGDVAPADFIPLAEQNGLIIPMGEWVLRNACCEAATWPEHLSVAVNLSSVQFSSARLLTAVSDALSRSGLSPKRLELEITESVLLENSGPVFEILRELRGLGVKIVMDDFGTGYSSLSYLRSFPFDRVKIDRSFVNDIKENPDSAAIVRAIIGLGRSLGMSTTAEGIETVEQHAQIEEEGCDFMQGFYYSKPITGEDVRKMIEEQQSRVA